MYKAKSIVTLSKIQLKKMKVNHILDIFIYILLYYIEMSEIKTQSGDGVIKFSTLISSKSSQQM